jgi:hypothetical protein
MQLCEFIAPILVPIEEFSRGKLYPLKRHFQEISHVQFGGHFLGFNGWEPKCKCDL